MLVDNKMGLRNIYFITNLFGTCFALCPPDSYAVLMHTIHELGITFVSFSCGAVGSVLIKSDVGGPYQKF